VLVTNLFLEHNLKWLENFKTFTTTIEYLYKKLVKISSHLDNYLKSNYNIVLFIVVIQSFVKSMKLYKKY